MRQLRSNFNQASGGATRTSSVKRRTLAERGTRRARQAWLREGKYHTRRQLCSRWPRRNGSCDPGHKAGRHLPSRVLLHRLCASAYNVQTNKKKKPVTVTVVACCHGLACNRSSLVRRVARVPLSLGRAGAHRSVAPRQLAHRTHASDCTCTHYFLRTVVLGCAPIFHCSEWSQLASATVANQPNRSV